MDILKSDETFRYQMLSRLKSDCEYYLNYGNKNSNALWAENVERHINTMKALWKSFDEDSKPEWLTWEDILEYARKMSI